MIIGDLPMIVELEELEEFDVFTYHFGDAFRLYLRGQFAVHRNVAAVNRIWTECAHLGSGLVAELEAKHRTVEQLAAEGRRGRARFLSAEGCYSWAVAHAPRIRLKIASKAFADFSSQAGTSSFEGQEFYSVHGALRKCSRPSLVAPWPPAGEEVAGGVAGEEAGRDSKEPSEEVCRPFGPRVAAHSPLLPGVQRPAGPAQPVTVHADCSSDWIQPQHRMCAGPAELFTEGDFPEPSLNLP